MEEPNSERIITPMPKSLVTAIDDYRFANRIESRAATIRRLIQAGLETAPGSVTSPPPEERRGRRKAAAQP
jgi:hypothetical protein